MAYTILTGDPRTVGTGNPPADVNNLNDVLTGIGAGLNVLSTAFSGGADPTGAADSAAAIQAALNACSPGQVAIIPPGLYKVSTPLSVPPYTGLVSWTRSSGSNFDWAGFSITGAVLQPSAGFPNARGVLEMINNTSAENGGQVIRNICVDGHLTSNTVHGIWSTGSVAAVTVEDVMVYHMTGTGVWLNLGGGFTPDTWYVQGLKVSHCAVGVSTVAPDTWWIGCESSENVGTNWVVNSSGNSRFIGCKGENSNTGYGWYISTSATAPVHLDVCGAQYNWLSGFKVTACGAGSIVKLNNCASTGDGMSTDSLQCGLIVTANAGSVMAPGFTCLIDTALGLPYFPNYGARLDTSSFGLTLSGALLQGNTAATFDDGSNTTPLISNLAAGTGAYGGLFGDGSDGAAALNGSNTVAWASLAASVYTMTRDCWLTSLTVSGGVTLKTAGYRVFCTGTVANAGTVSNNGNAAVAAAAGAATANGSLGRGAAGGAGGTGNGVAGNGALAMVGTGSGAAGGAGTATTGGAGAAASASSVSNLRAPQILATGTFVNLGVAVPISGAGGGGSGGGDATNSGGGGGGGGGVVGILARAVVNTAGTISATGGAGGTAAAGNCGGGGGGGGGLILVCTLTPWAAGTTAVTGGAAGLKTGTGVNGSAGGNGSVLNVVVQ